VKAPAFQKFVKGSLDINVFISDYPGMNYPRVIIAGTHSGCGKTTITMGIIKALSRHNFTVSPYKTGPDYIDPGFHSLAAGRKCRNLDSMMLERDVVLELFEREAVFADISVIEGVMGLFDGAGGMDERGSASHLSKLTDTPVILVIDARAMAQSAGAIALGFNTFDPELNLAGFIVNRVGSERHFEMVKTAIEDSTGLPVFGFMPKDNELSIPERHLGLIPSWEKDRTSDIISKIADAVEKNIDINSIISLAKDVSSLPVYEKSIFLPSGFKKEASRVIIAVAWDSAFCFYYDDNIDMLKYYGAEIVYFSPLKDEALPENISALYFGGGYPELFAEDLSKNENLINEIRHYAGEGMPILAECGGFMYLCTELTDMKGDIYSMTGIFPGRTVMDKKLRSLGYCESTNLKDNFLGKKGSLIRGHMFHWAYLDNVPEFEKSAFSIKKGDKIIDGGFYRYNTLGSWVHFHFGSNPHAAENFVSSARDYNK